MPGDEPEVSRGMESVPKDFERPKDDLMELREFLKSQKWKDYEKDQRRS